MDVDGVSFGYSNILKTYFKQGKFKGLKSFTGEELTKVSLDHIIPHSHGGPSVTGNYILTNVKENTMRDTQSIDYYLDKNYKRIYITNIKKNIWKTLSKVMEKFQTDRI